MTFKELQKKCSNEYLPAILLEQSFPRKQRKVVGNIFLFLALFLVAVALFLNFFGSIPQVFPYVHFVYKIYALLSVLFSLLLVLFSLNTFFNSFYFKKRGEKNDQIFVDYDLSAVISLISEKDPLGSFLGTPLGSFFMLRCGIENKNVLDYLNSRTVVLDENAFSFQPEDNQITLRNIILSFMEGDKEFCEFLFKNSIQKKEVVAIADWIEETLAAQKLKTEWWSEEHLSRFSSIGRDWSYGQTWQLDKFEKPIPITGLERYEIHSSYGVDELNELETILARSREANGLLIGNDEAGKMSIISHLLELIEEGKVLAELQSKRVILFDADLFVSAFGTKADFELNFSNIMIEAENAGNIILVIDNFPSFIASVTAIGSDLSSIFGSFLKSSLVQVIALSDTDRFHQFLEPNTALMQHFEKIFVKEINEQNTIKVLENELENFEKVGFFFTYPALVAIAESAERYFSDGVMPDKAVDLLLEIAPKLEAAGKTFVEKTDVLDLVEQKTGIPVGEIKNEEKDKLLNLEKILHDRIIGQEVAVEAISNAMRRARSGIENPDRPMGSFLFLGPTGVGKTETTKALAQVFFGAESHIIRLDMSEYSSYDAVSKLIGSFEGHQNGVLSTLLREHPYGVLLLDEFEKTTKEVMNLFLQILDEGFFSDMSGHRVNARNLIIIATSNAGSDMIWQAVKDGRNPVDEKDKIIDSLVASGVFRPEFINRFDGVIVFHPLSNSDLRQIAVLMLKKLQKRLAEKGIDLSINDAIVEFLVSKGSDPKFGARPLNRAIEETIEQVISKKIISGSLKSGSKLLLTQEELSGG